MAPVACYAMSRPLTGAPRYPSAQAYLPPSLARQHPTAYHQHAELILFQPGFGSLASSIFLTAFLVDQRFFCLLNSWFSLLCYFVRNPLGLVVTRGQVFTHHSGNTLLEGRTLSCQVPQASGMCLVMNTCEFLDVSPSGGRGVGVSHMWWDAGLKDGVGSVRTLERGSEELEWTPLRKVGGVGPFVYSPPLLAVKVEEEH